MHTGEKKRETKKKREPRIKDSLTSSSTSFGVRFWEEDSKIDQIRSQRQRETERDRERDRDREREGECVCERQTDRDRAKRRKETER